MSKNFKRYEDKAQKYMESQKYKKAIKEFKMCLSLTHDKIKLRKIHAGLGIAYMQSDYSRSLHHLNRSLEGIDPKELLRESQDLLLGPRLESMQTYSVRRRLVAEKLALYSTLYLMRGRIRGARHQYQEALQDLQTAKDLGYNMPDLYERIADIHILREDFYEAKKNYNKAISLNPSNARLYSARAYCHIELNDHDAGLRDYETSLSLSSNPDFKKQVTQVKEKTIDTIAANMVIETLIDEGWDFNSQALKKGNLEIIIKLHTKGFHLHVNDTIHKLTPDGSPEDRGMSLLDIIDKAA